jgi:ribonuclease PH
MSEWILGLIAFGLFVYFVPYKNLQKIQYLQNEGLIKLDKIIDLLKDKNGDHNKIIDLLKDKK